jgi:CheY-like chemotaxis protein
LAKPVIICVDDEKIVLDSLKSQLFRHLDTHYKIELAESGEEAMDVVIDCLRLGHEIPLVISDQIMRGMDGSTLLGRIKERSPDTLNIL